MAWLGRWEGDGGMINKVDKNDHQRDIFASLV
jgi:hypothetical protein